MQGKFLSESVGIFSTQPVFGGKGFTPKAICHSNLDSSNSTTISLLKKTIGGQPVPFKMKKKFLKMILPKRREGDRSIGADLFRAVLPQFLLGCWGQAVIQKIKEITVKNSIKGMVFTKH